MAQVSHLVRMRAAPGSPGTPAPGSSCRASAGSPSSCTARRCRTRHRRSASGPRAHLTVGGRRRLQDVVAAGTLPVRRGQDRLGRGVHKQDRQSRLFTICHGLHSKGVTAVPQQQQAGQLAEETEDHDHVQDAGGRLRRANAGRLPGHPAQHRAAAASPGPSAPAATTRVSSSRLTQANDFAVQHAGPYARHRRSRRPGPTPSAASRRSSGVSDIAGAIRYEWPMSIAVIAAPSRAADVRPSATSQPAAGADIRTALTSRSQDQHAPAASARWPGRSASRPPRRSSSDQTSEPSEAPAAAPLPRQPAATGHGRRPRRQTRTPRRSGPGRSGSGCGRSAD